MSGDGPVERWQLRLAERVGMGADERAALRAGLDEFCAARGITPEEVLTTWLDHPELTVRRRPGTAEPPNLAVESFLVHNGVNVFGEIVCVAGRPDDLAEQGEQFLRRDRE